MLYLLVFIVIHFAEVMSNVTGREYHSHPQYIVVNNFKPGQNPSTDSALVALENECRKPVTLFEYKPVTLFEYKPTIHPEMMLLDP